MGVELHPVPMTGGVNLFNDPRTIRDDEVCWAKNVFPTIKGMHSKRKGIAWVGQGPAYNETPTNLFIPPTGELDFVSTAVHASSLTATAYAGKADGSLARISSLPYVAGYRPHITAFGDDTYILHGAAAAALPSVFPMSRVRVVSGSPVLEHIEFDGTGNENLIPRAACIYRDRMVYGNLGTGFENRILFSDKWDPRTVGTNAINTFSLVLPALAGDRVVAMVEVFLSQIGGPPATALLVLGERNSVLVTGQPQQSTYVGSDYFKDTEQNRTSYPVGCVSAETVVRTPYGIVWAGHDDVWMFTTGSMPMRIGSKLRPVLKHTPANRHYLWHAAYHDGVYRLAIMSEGQGAADWDPCGEQWWLDLRDGPPQSHADARWWGPQVFNIAKQENVAATPGTYCMASETRHTKDSMLWGIHPGTREAGGGLLQQFVQYDVNMGFDSAMNITGAQFYTAVPVSREVGNDIDIEILTKSYAFNDPQTDKLFMGAEVSLWTSELVQLACEVIADGGRRVYDEQIRFDEIDQTGFIAGVDSLETRVTQEFQSIMLPESENHRDPGKFLQFRLYDTPGWPVPENGVNYRMVWTPLNTNVPVTTEMTADFYADRDTFLDMLCTRMSLVTGTTITHSLNLNGTVRITDAGGVLGTIIFDASLAPNEDPNDVRRCRKVFSSIGYDTASSSVTGVLTGFISASEPVRNVLSASLDIAGIMLRIYRFGRRPEHARE